MYNLIITLNGIVTDVSLCSSESCSYSELCDIAERIVRNAPDFGATQAQVQSYKNMYGEYDLDGLIEELTIILGPYGYNITYVIMENPSINEPVRTVSL